MNQAKLLNWAFLQWQAKQFAKQLGLAGWVGLALIIISIGFYLTTFLPVQSELSASQDNLVQLKKDNANQNVKLKTVQRDSVNEIRNFYAAFPNGASLSNSLRLIQKIAIKHKLELNHGDYKLVLTQLAPQNTELVRYEIRLPISGKYIQIRTFIADVMNEIPSLALTEMQIKRESSTSPLVDVQMVFVMFVKADVWR